MAEEIAPEVSIEAHPEAQPDNRKLYVSNLDPTVTHLTPRFLFERRRVIFIKFSRNLDRSSP